MWDWIVGIFESQLGNQFFAGGLLLGLMGALAVWLRALPGHVASFVSRQFVTTIVVDNRSSVFFWFLEWINQHPYNARSRLMSVSTSFDGLTPREEGSIDRPRLFFSPAPGIHIFFHRGKLLWVNRDIEISQMAGRSGGATMSTFERITIRCVGRERDFLTGMMQDALNYSADRDYDRTVIYALDQWSHRWRRQDGKTRRRIDTVILDGKLADELMADVRWYLGAKDWYVERGIPWRRGYLFYGPPGTGKTSIISALAGEMGLSICTFDVASDQLNNDKLISLISLSPAGCIILLEDVDAVFSERRVTDNTSRVTFSGLLNAIDGIVAQEGRMVFMTTNHIEKLDRALVRPGRADVRVEVGLASRDQLRRMFLKFYPGEETRAAAFAGRLPDRKLSAARVQEHFLTWRDDPAHCLENIGKLVAEGGSD